MATEHTTGRERTMLPKKHFSAYRAPLVALPDLIEPQRESFRSLAEEGLKEVFKEFSPISDYSNKKFELSFKKYVIGAPKCTPEHAKENKLTYDAPLRATVALKNKTFGSEKEQEIFLADMPLMTEHGTFIINGVERVIVPQLARSYGVFFTADEVRGKKYFGAKIIPARGAWVEMESDPDGALYVRVDRKRKFPVTALFRVFGAKTKDDVLALFADAPEARALMTGTLTKDPSESVEDAYIEIYKRLRDGDLATAENAREFVDSIFSTERYDLSEIGRYQFNQRFGAGTGEKDIAQRTIGLADLVTIVRHIAAENGRPGAEADDIDHLGFRRVRYFGEMIQQRIRVGFARMKRNIQDRMSTIESETSLPMQLINPRPLQAAIKEFYTTNQLSQFMQQENLLVELEGLRTLSALGPGGLTRERAGFEVRDVHPSHYGRLCPIQTPEGPNIGLIVRLAMYARVNKYGIIETPYAKVVDGRVTGDIVYLNAHDEERYTIAHAGTEVGEDDRIMAENVEARRAGEPHLAAPDEVDYMDIATNQAFSVATSMIPFLNHDDANRALMGSNMQKQAVPCLVPEAPLVATGIEEVAARDTGRIIAAHDAGEVTAVDARRIVVKGKNGKSETYPLSVFERTNDFSAFYHRPVVSLGQKVKRGELLADTSSTEGGQIALGQNALVAFMSWSGANYEDAIIISERLVKNSKFASVHMDELEVSVRDTKLGAEVTTADIPNVSDQRLRNLDENGIIRVGAEVRPGDILVGKVTPKGETQLTPEERLLRSIFGEKAKDVKDTSLRLPAGKKGRIVGVKVFSREQGDQLESGVIKRIHVTIAQVRNVAVGDKLAGRHGNKGVISRILPEEDMPYTEDGRPIDVILTPLGLPSRMNLGQILEMHLGMAAHTLGYQAIVPPFAGATEEEIKAELTAAGLPEDGKMWLRDGRTGEQFAQKSAVGYMYILKLHHMVEDKIHMRSIGPYSLITQQPLGGKAQVGGQRFGEMEVWALLGYGAAYTLREMLTIKSDDIVGRSMAFDAIVRGERIGVPHTPASFNVLLNQLRGLGLDVELTREESSRPSGASATMSPPVFQPFDAVSLRLASPERILAWSQGEVTKPETINYRTQRPERYGLFDERIFGPVEDYECACKKYRGIRYKGIVCEKCGVEITRAIVRRDRMGHIDLCVPVSHIWFLRSVPSRIALILGLSAASVEKVVYFAGYIVTSVNETERTRLLRELESEFKAKVKELTTEQAREELKNRQDEIRAEISGVRAGMVLDEAQYHKYSVRYSTLFEAHIGAEAIYELLRNTNLATLRDTLLTARESASAAERARLDKRLSLIRGMLAAGVEPYWMFLTRIPVIPPALRPMVALEGGRHASSDLNDLYRRVINRNNRLKKLIEIHAPDVILRNEKRILQEAVDALIDNSIRHGAGAYSAMTQAQRRPLKSLSDYLKSKQGYFRQNLLGKRVDYSGRSVIVIGPELALDQCGLPKHMALELFRPFVIAELLKRELAFNIRGAGRLIEDAVPEVWAILEEVIAERHVLLNRAPTLHRQGIQAFRPVLIEGDAIQVHPLVCRAFNADFDGDQMAVHIPLSMEAQLEAREVMSANKNILKPGSAEPVVSEKLLDMALGCYWMTKIIPGAKGEGMAFESPNAAITAHDFGIVDFRAQIKVLGTESEKYAAFDGQPFETSVGRLLFNSVLPAHYAYLNEVISQKALFNIVVEIIDREGVDAVPKIVDRIKQVGFTYATRSGVTWGIDDVIVPKEKQEILDGAREEERRIMAEYQGGLLSREERRRFVIDLWHRAKTALEKVIPSALGENGSVYDMWQSGARGSLGQIAQMAGMKGLIVNTRGETLEFPVTSSMKEGMSPIEYFVTTHGSRKGLADTALQTAKAGYLTRRLFDVAQDAVITELDCKTKEGVVISRTSASGIAIAFSKAIRGRVAAADVTTGDGEVLFTKGRMLSRADGLLVEERGVESVMVRSPMTCKTLRGVCQRCYGVDLTTDKLVDIGEAVGTIAAQAIGEPGTQLTMNTKHAGGTAQVGGDVTQGLPRVEEVFEKRTPKIPAVISKTDGFVVEMRQDGRDKTIVVAPDARGTKEPENIEYPINYHRSVLVREGESVRKGQPLTDGSAALGELFNYGGEQVLQEYIIAETSRIYELQGVTIARKHIELIVKQMLSRFKVTDPGESQYTVGDTVEEWHLTETNRALKEADKAEAKAEKLVLGITEVALSRRSFLSAASFQNTTRVLINAAVRGSVDRLVGLKENVIIGRLIPAGTGFAGSAKHAMIAALPRPAAPAGRVRPFSRPPAGADVVR